LFITVTLGAQTNEPPKSEASTKIVVRDFRPQGGKRLLKSGQNVNDGYEQLLKNNTPVSPQAEAIEKYSCYSVNYSTGVPQISIPLYEINVGGYTLPISIEYHASGIKVQDMATPVGLGWTLNAGGVVNKQVKGTEDHFKNNRLDLKYTSEREISNDMAYASNKTNYWWHRLAAKGEGDTESDRYTYSFNGKNGVFRYCVTDGSLRTIPYSGVKIDTISNGGYVVIDTDGTKYYFHEGENNTDYASSTLMATTTWYITKIEPSTNKNNIEFTYASGKTYSMDYISQMNNEGYSYDLESEGYPNEWYNINSNPFFRESFHAYCGSNHVTKLLSQISWAGNTMISTTSRIGEN